MSDPSEVRTPTPRPLPVLLLADVSGSMREHGKIETLNRSVSEMLKAFTELDHPKGEVWVGVITFGGEGAQVHQQVRPAREVIWEDMGAGGHTPMGDAFETAAKLIEDAEAIPAQARYPVLVLLSDGRPTDANGRRTDDWKEPLAALRAGARGSKATRLAVSIGADVDPVATQILEEFIGDPERQVIPAEDASSIADFFEWLTMSVSTQASGASVSYLYEQALSPEWASDERHA